MSPSAKATKASNLYLALGIFDFCKENKYLNLKKIVVLLFVFLLAWERIIFVLDI